MHFVVPETASGAGRWTSRLAIFSVVLILAALFLHRLFGMPTPVAVNVLKVAYLGAVVSLLAGMWAAIEIWRHGDPGAARVVVGITLSLALLSAPLWLMGIVREYPPITDVTTDTSDPPPFETLGPERGPDANPVAYPASFAAEQAQAFPDLRSMRVHRSGAETFEIVVEAIKRLRYDVVSEEPPGETMAQPGLLEAVDRSLILGLYDDVAIRVAGDDTTALIDLRSSARYLPFDLGRNAERLREIMKEIVMRLEATVPAADTEQIVRPKVQPEVKRGRGGGPNSRRRRTSANPDQSTVRRGRVRREPPPD